MGETKVSLPVIVEGSDGEVETSLPEKILVPD